MIRYDVQHGGPSAPSKKNCRCQLGVQHQLQYRPAPPNDRHPRHTQCAMIITSSRSTALNPVDDKLIKGSCSQGPSGGPSALHNGPQSSVRTAQSQTWQVIDSGALFATWICTDSIQRSVPSRAKEADTPGKDGILSISPSRLWHFGGKPSRHQEPPTGDHHQMTSHTNLTTPSRHCLSAVSEF